MTSENEKKGASKPQSLSEQFKQELDDVTRKVRPIMDDLMSQVNDITRDINQAKAKGIDDTAYYNALLVEKRVVAVAWMVYYEMIESKRHDYLLALRSEQTPTDQAQQIIHAAQEGKKTVDEHIAKRLGQLFGKGGGDYIS